MAMTELLEASARMLASAQAADWDNVAVHAAERDRLLGAPSTSDIAPGEIFGTLLAHNEAVIDLVSRARDQIGEALGQHTRTHQALNTYLHTAID